MCSKPAAASAAPITTVSSRNPRNLRSNQPRRPRRGHRPPDAHRPLRSFMRTWRCWHRQFAIRYACKGGTRVVHRCAYASRAHADRRGQPANTGWLLWRRCANRRAVVCRRHTTRAGAITTCPDSDAADGTGTCPGTGTDPCPGANTRTRTNANTRTDTGANTGSDPYAGHAVHRRACLRRSGRSMPRQSANHGRTRGRG
jgi:hypothetical protein